MEYVIKYSWLLCLTAAALQDLKTRQISLMLFVTGSIPGIWNLCTCGTDMQSHLGAALIGILMLILSWLTKGALGEGDGCFFLFSALYWKAGQVCLLFLGSLGIACIWGMGLFMYGRWCGNLKKANATIPLLACAWPIGAWLVIR